MKHYESWNVANEQTNQTNVPKQLGNRQTKENTASVFQNCKNRSALIRSEGVANTFGRSVESCVACCNWLDVAWKMIFIVCVSHRSLKWDILLMDVSKKFWSGLIFCLWISGSISMAVSQGTATSATVRVLILLHEPPLRVTQTSWSKDEFARGSRVQTHPGGSRKGMKSKDWDLLEVSATWFRTMSSPHQHILTLPTAKSWRKTLKTDSLKFRASDSKAWL